MNTDDMNEVRLGPNLSTSDERAFHRMTSISSRSKRLTDLGDNHTEWSPYLRQAVSSLSKDQALRPDSTLVSLVKF